MRTGLFLLAGFLLLAASLVLAKLFSENYPSATAVATAVFVALWLALTGFNMWVGVVKAGYSPAEELPILLLLFGVPAGVAIVLKWNSLNQLRVQPMPKVNAKWHAEHRMPKRATPQQRIAWHQEHSKHCACRPIPKGVLVLIAASKERGA